jgi:pimeloyl-ACP methyl ester carboxylesterase
MPIVHANNLDHNYEQAGEGPPLVLVHGAFVDARLWEPQWRHFCMERRLLRYDLRGHGKTGASAMPHYTIDTFADDLSCLLDELEIEAPVVCGQSFGGSIALAAAARDPGRFKGLVIASGMVSIRLTWIDKIMCDVLFPKWAMLLTLQKLSVPNFVRFSLWLGRLAQGRNWLSQDANVLDYLKQCMLQMDGDEYQKIWEALYGFNPLHLDAITCPTLLLNGEVESRNMFQHSRFVLSRIPQAEHRIVPAARHAINIEQPEIFNQFVAQFIRRLS